MAGKSPKMIGVERIPAYALKMLPYILTILIMIFVNACRTWRRFDGPAALGIPFNCEG